MCCCDYDGPTIYDARDTRARKKHVCSECLRDIGVGETYERVDGLWEGHWSHFATCDDCLLVRKIIDDATECFCLCHGQLMDWTDERDFPGVREVADFNRRRKGNYERLRGPRRLR